MCIVSASVDSLTLQPFPHPVLSLALSAQLVIACGTENQWESWYVISFEWYGDREDGRARIPPLLSLTTSVVHVVGLKNTRNFAFVTFCFTILSDTSCPCEMLYQQALLAFPNCKWWKAGWEPGNEAVIWLVPVNQGLSWSKTEIGNQKLAEGIVQKLEEGIVQKLAEGIVQKKKWSSPFQNWTVPHFLTLPY